MSDPRRSFQKRTQPSSPRGFKNHALWIAALWIFLLAAYSNSFHAGFVFDSSPIILHDARVHAATAENIERIWTHGYWPDRVRAGLYRPLTTFSFLLNWAVWGNDADPQGYHWLNFVLHGINATLVFALGLLIFETPFLAIALAAIWALHPLLTEAVTNIVGRADLLAALGVLAALLCYLRGRSSRGMPMAAWLAGFTAAFMLGLFSKENAIALIALMLLYDLAWSAPLKHRWPFYGAGALAAAAFLFARAQSHPQMQVLFTDNPLESAGFVAARLTAVKVIGKYLGLFLLPLKLSPDYSFHAIPVFSVSEPAEIVKAAISTLACATLLAAGIRYRRTHRDLFFFALFFFVALLPVSNLFILIGSIMAERFAYLPSIGLAGCAVIALRGLATRIPARSLQAAAAVLCIALAAATYARNADWADEASLWTSAVAAYPANAKAHLNLGHAYSQVPGRSNDAIREYKEALRIEPDYAQAHYNLGSALSSVPGQIDSAVAEYRAALECDPEFAEAHNNLGESFAREGHRQDAIAEYEAAIRIDPEYAEPHSNLGNLLASIPGRQADAISEYRTALKLQPELAEAHFNLANALLQMPGRTEEGIAEYRQAIAAEPNLAAPHNNLGIVLAQIPGKLPEAITEFEAAIRIQPDYADAHLNLGMALAQSVAIDRAIAEFEAAVRADPQLVRAHYNLGVALAQAGRTQDAIRELEAANRLRPDPNLETAIRRLRAGN